MNRPKRPVFPQHLPVESLESRQLFSTSANPIISPSLVINSAASSSDSVGGYTPAQIRSAYGISSISLNGVAGTGAGQTIAIVDAYSDPNIGADLAVFDKQFGLASANFTQLSSTGSTTKLPSIDAGWAGEISLDVEWAHAIAPQAKIILVDASSSSLSSLMSAVKYARSISSVSVISMSWGSSEFYGQASYDKYFTTPKGHIGITFVAASGDQGASGGAEWPASSPNVLAVGGTTLSLTDTGTVASETAWSGSSGGVSSYESTPSYQSAVSSGGRSTPDVSFNADPNTGFAVYDSVDDQGYVGWQVVGGTSAGSPSWAGLISIADQGRVANGLHTLDGATGTLPAIYSLYSDPAKYAAKFTDITSGSSILYQVDGYGGPFGGGGYLVGVSASAGYDTLTGVGTPKAAALVAALSSVSVSRSSVVKSATASVAKIAKTRNRAAAAIDINQVASVLGVVSAAAPAPTPSYRFPSNVELEITAGTTAAATLAPTNSGVADAATVNGRPLFPADARSSTAAGDADASVMRRLFADASASAKALAASAAGTVSEIGIQSLSTASTIPGLFSGAAIAREFREAVTDVIRAAAPTVAGPHEHSSASTWVVEGAAAIADVILVGYFYAKRKQTADGESVFSDEPMS